VGDRLRDLGDEQEAGRGALAPLRDRLRGGDTVKSRVDLDGVELGA